MGTRATYQFGPANAGSYNQSVVTFYIHWDGYPQGAASYFNEALVENLSGGRVQAGNLRLRNGRLPEAFLRANDEAEFTGGHEDHGDTEYRYTVNGNNLLAEERVNFSDQWRVFFDGTVFDFINTYRTLVHNGEVIEMAPVWIEIPSPKRYESSEWVNSTVLVNYVDALEQGIAYMEANNYGEDNPNLANARRELDGYQASLLGVLEAA